MAPLGETSSGGRGLSPQLVDLNPSSVASNRAPGPLDTSRLGAWTSELGLTTLGAMDDAVCTRAPSQETFASDDFPAASLPGWEVGGGRLGVSATAGLRAPLGIPIELFLMRFNFHFLLLENTDGDLLPLTHTERGADRERDVQ